MGTTTIVEKVFVDEKSTVKELLEEGEKRNAQFKEKITKDLNGEKIYLAQDGVNVAIDKNEIAKGVTRVIQALVLGKPPGSTITKQDETKLDQDNAYKTVLISFQTVMDTIISNASQQGVSQQGSYLYSSGFGIARVYYQVYSRTVTAKSGVDSIKKAVIFWSYLGCEFTEELTNMKLRSILETMAIPFHVKKDLYDGLKDLCKK